MAEIEKPTEGGPESQTQNSSTPTAVDEITPTVAPTAEARGSLDVDEKRISDLEGQDGVRDIEAITQTWSKKMLIITYVWYEKRAFREPKGTKTRLPINLLIGF